MRIRAASSCSCFLAWASYSSHLFRYSLKRLASLLFLASMALVYFLGSFPNALDFTVFAIVLATSADMLALFALRSRRPDLVRPYRAWGYPVVPAIYLVLNLAIGVALLIGSPRESFTTLALLAAGLLIYFPFARRSARD